MLGLTSIVMAAGLAFAAPAGAQAPQAAATPAAAAPAAATAQQPAPPAAAPSTEEAPAVATPADPTLTADGKPRAPSTEIGVPRDGAIAIQPQVTPNGVRAEHFHNWILLPLITFISLLVLALLVWTIIRYRRAANPEPSKTSHNTLIEVIWTLVPVFILLAIAVPSISLLAAQFKPAPANAVTLKAIGNQWFWSYEYPDHGGVQITANMLKEKDQVEPGQRFRTDADGPRLLATDNRIVLPVGVPIRLITTATDVIHSWAVPAFWIKLDAVPGKLNETSFTIDKPGIYYGQCSELCGARHAFMPITVEAVPMAEFEQWVRAKGGTLPADAAAADAANASASNTAVPAAGNDTADDTATPADGTGPVVNATATPATTNQAATANPAGLGQTDNAND